MATVGRVKPVSERPRRGSAWLGYALAAAAATSWGAQSIVAKLLLTSGLPIGSLVSTRTALASLILAGALAVVKPAHLLVGPRQLLAIAALGIAMAASQYAYYFALTRIPVATALLLIYTAPLFVLGASVLVMRQRVRAPDVMAAAVTLVGAALVVRIYAPDAFRLSAAGIGASLLSAVAFAFYSLWGQRAAPAVSPWTVATYSLGSAALLWLPFAPPWALLIEPHPTTVWLGLGVVIVFGTLLPFALYLSALAHISAAHASVTASLEPVVAAAAAYVVLGERLEALQAMGGALVLAGSAVVHSRR
jgi:drug/metabolite transporter (DMT)-like permease